MSTTTEVTPSGQRSGLASLVQRIRGLHRPGPQTWSHFMGGTSKNVIKCYACTGFSYPCPTLKAAEQAIVDANYGDKVGRCIICGAGRYQPCDTISEPGTVRDHPHFYRARIGVNEPDHGFTPVRDEPDFADSKT